MLFTSEDYVKSIREHMRGGDGDVELISYFPSEILPKKCRFLANVVLQSGCSIGYHDHIDETELYIFTEGNGSVSDNGVDRDVKPGDVLSTYNQSHSVTNTGNKPLKFLAIIILD